MSAQPATTRLLCGTRGCPQSGYWVEVDPAAVAFAAAEQVPVLCGGCCRPLTRITVRQAAGTTPTRGARP